MLLLLILSVTNFSRFDELLRTAADESSSLWSDLVDNDRLALSFFLVVGDSIRLRLLPAIPFSNYLASGDDARQDSNVFLVLTKSFVVYYILVATLSIENVTYYGSFLEVRLS